MEVTIKWENYAKNSYTFGSRISFKDGQVIFDNPLMSPSFALTSWSSRTNFQAQRTQSDLPLLKRGSTYYIKLVADIHPANSLYIKVTYFDRLGETIYFDVLKDEDWQFTYPKNAFHYTVELINAGCERVIFEHFVLSDLTVAEDFSEQGLDTGNTVQPIYYDDVEGVEQAELALIQGCFDRAYRPNTQP